MARNFKTRVFGFVVAIALATIAMIVAPITVQVSGATVIGADEAQATTVTRLSGADRYKTMQAVVDKGFSHADSVVIATGTNYPDALSAAGLAGLLDAPVILTDSKSLSPEARYEINRLGASTAYLVGGNKALSSRVVSDLKGMGLTCRRASGDTRQATAVAVYEMGAKRGLYSWSETAIVASGSSFADALSASSFSYAMGAPIFLTESNGSLSRSTLSAIRSGGFSEVLVLGGTKVVPSSTYSAIKSAGLRVTRLAGDNRYQTSWTIANFAMGRGMTVENMAFATGTNFPDALSGGAFCGKNWSVLMLIEGGFPASAKPFMQAHNGEANRIYVLGGEAAVNAASLRYMKQYAAGNFDYYEAPPAPPAPPASSGAAISGATGGTIVYFTPMGKKYHYSWCPTIANSRVVYNATLQNAKMSGRTYCHVCNPPA